MELKHKLEKIFNNDYPGTERFIADVIEPIFGNEIEYINDDLAERESYTEKAKKAGIKHIKYIGDLTEKNYNAENIALLDVTLDDSKDIERSRVNIQQLIRSIMDYRQHLMIVFHYEDVTNKQWRFSYAYKGESLKDTTSAKRYTYVFGKGYRGRTAAERFQALADSPRNNENFEEAFSVAALSDEFFEEYRNLYADFVQYITGKRYVKEGGKWVERELGIPNSQYAASFEKDDKLVRDYIKKMFGRIVFLYFLQRKGWLNSNRYYMRDLYANSDKKDNFLDEVLESLFFNVLNEKPENRPESTHLLPGVESIPYLNGGLFAKDNIDERTCVFPEEYFGRLFSFLDSYNFTIDENDQEDAEIGIDPEMLGRIFENLLEDNKDKGTFYTPKEIVEYMCRESLIAYLQDDRFTGDGNALIRSFVETLNREGLSDKQRLYLKDKLKVVKICDPAIGSGAFPMGLVNLLAKLYIALGVKSDELSAIKRHIIESNIYGVDIEQGAVDIARLRFWLAMVVDEDKPSPLPNLHFKIMQGNSLLESYKGKDLSGLTQVNIGASGSIDLQSEEAKSLISDLSKFYNESDHNERKIILDGIIKNVQRQIYFLTQSEDFMTDVRDISANDQFFLWHTWFADVFQNGGFDIVIGNPPYVLVAATDKHKLVYDTLYSVAKGGKRNLYHLFFEKGINLLKPNGCLCFITPDTFLSGNDTTKLRRFFIQNVNIDHIIHYKESDRVFENVTQAVAITLLIKQQIKEDFKIKYSNGLDVIVTSNLNEGNKYIFKASNSVIDKMNMFIRTFGDVCYGYKGDVNLGLKKSFFSNDPSTNSLPLVRGVQIGRYSYKPGKEFCSMMALTRDDTKHKRIVFQEIANMGLDHRVKGTILEGVILGDSTNAIYPKDPSNNIFYLLSLLNSKAVNYYFKYFNQTNHVPIGELKKIPVPNSDFKIQRILEDLAKEQLQSYTSRADVKIDIIVYHLYGLTYDEVLIIDPETPISREEYEKK